MMAPLHEWTAIDLAEAVRCGDLTATAIAEHFLERIGRVDQTLHAFVEVFAASTLAAAAALDDSRAKGRSLGPLAGVPVALKDNLVRRGHTAAAGSRILQDWVSPYSATVVERLERAGALLIGRTNMDEFGMGSSTEHSAFGPTRNPWRHDLVPGGSSGGSAAAVAADLCPLAVGSDTGGSVRQPAAMCGVTGLKPTYGAVSRYGLIAYASSLDCVGVCARTAEDTALWLDVVGGPDAADPTSAPEQAAPIAARLRDRADLRGLTIAMPDELNGVGIDGDVAAAVRHAADRFAELGARVTRASLPSVAHAVPAYYLIATAEASSNLARYDGIRYGPRGKDAGPEPTTVATTRSAGFGAEVQLRILLGTFALRAGYQEQFYGRANRIRDLLRADFDAAFAHCDVLLCPTAPAPAFPIGSRTDDPLAMYLGDAMTVPMSLAGLPAVSLPCGATADGRPIGVQCTAPRWREHLLLQVAHVYQQSSRHHLRRAAS